jgi:hypothetical protein
MRKGKERGTYVAMRQAHDSGANLYSRLRTSQERTYCTVRLRMSGPNLKGKLMKYQNNQRAGFGCASSKL